VVITGTGSGIGQATAILLTKLGAADLVCIDVNIETAKLTAATCRNHGTDAIGYPCDVADPAELGFLAEKIENQRGPVDIVINNAGVTLGGQFLDHATDDDWNWIMGVNLNGVSYGCKAF
jgi:NAD(P)-dependent dehydrogenase (short-subunit alcohol dehydrogenase family)